MTTPRRRVVEAVLRATLTSTVLVVLYYRLPFTAVVDASTFVLLAAGLALFAAVITWQVRSILRSAYPALRAIEALGAAIPLFLLVFAAAYVKLADTQAEAFTEPLSRTDALYFTITVFATVGFGDIAPVTDAARITTMVQMVGDLLVVGLVLRLMLGAVKQGRERRAGAAGASDSPDRGDAGPPAPPYLAKHDGPGT
ncbi:MAG TPA: potassium channel family protein [Actinomycetota bacterium]|jgi:voltage-gated potassium channel|nr:potassium channel family protein [Actinomycetota bacterium]